MEESLFKRLYEITDEEIDYLSGRDVIREDIYFSGPDTTVDAAKLLERGRLIEVRPHTRFVHFPRHNHNYVEMVYMVKGTTTHILNGSDRVVLKEGELLFLNQHASQEIEAAGVDDIAVNFIILPEFFENHIAALPTDTVLRSFLIDTISGGKSEVSYMHFHTGSITPIQNIMENMIWYALGSKKSPEINLILRTSMELLIMNLSSYASHISHDTVSGSDQDLSFKTLKYIENQYRSGSLSDLSIALDIEPYALSRILKRVTGHNFKELLQERKLQQASYYLTETTMTVESIMNEIGYENSSYFYRIFRAKYGCSPREYRKRKESSKKLYLTPSSTL